MPEETVCVLRGAFVCVLVLLVDPLSPHKDFGFAVQREGAVVLPEAVKQLHVFELAVLVAHWKTHSVSGGLRLVRSLPA